MGDSEPRRLERIEALYEYAEFVFAADATNPAGAADARVLAAQSLIDQAEQPGRCPSNRQAMLEEAFSLLNHAPERTPAVEQKLVRLRALMRTSENGAPDRSERVFG